MVRPLHLSCLSFVLALTIFAPAAHAAVPDPACSTVPCGMVLVGSTGGVADPCGQFTITVKSGPVCTPINGSAVVIDFSTCVPDIRLAATQTWPGMTVNCIPHSVSMLTVPPGVATFRIIGSATNAPGCTPGAGYKCARVYADGVQLGVMNVGTIDENGTGGVSATDLASFAADFFSVPGQACYPYVGRSDYDCSHALGAADLSKWLSCFFAAGSAVSGSPVCPP